MRLNRWTKHIRPIDLPSALLLALGFHIGLGSALYEGAKPRTFPAMPAGAMVEFEATLGDHLEQHLGEKPDHSLDAHRGHADAVSIAHAGGGSHVHRADQDSAGVERSHANTPSATAATAGAPLILERVYGNASGLAVRGATVSHGRVGGNVQQGDDGSARGRGPGSALSCDEEHMQRFFPERAREAGLTQAVVTMDITISVQGDVSARALNDPGYGLARAAEEAVRVACHAIDSGVARRMRYAIRFVQD